MSGVGVQALLCVEEERGLLNAAHVGSAELVVHTQLVCCLALVLD